VTTLAEAAAQADALAVAGEERKLADLRHEWDEHLEDAARDADFRLRAAAFRAIGQFRYRQKIELLGRGLDDQSPACRGSALISLELLSRDHPRVVNDIRSVLHRLASADPNDAVKRLAIVCLSRTSPNRDTITLLAGMADDDRYERDTRDAAKKTSAALKKRADTAK
jgi:hypothetical protein